MAAASIEDILAKSGLTEITGPFALMREDTHGCQYMMQGHFSEAAANYLAKHYNDLGHDQYYWAERQKTQNTELMPPVPLR